MKRLQWSVIAVIPLTLMQLALAYDMTGGWVVAAAYFGGVGSGLAFAYGMYIGMRKRALEDEDGEVGTHA